MELRSQTARRGKIAAGQRLKCFFDLYVKQEGVAQSNHPGAFIRRQRIAMSAVRLLVPLPRNDLCLRQLGVLREGRFQKSRLNGGIDTVKSLSGVAESVVQMSFRCRLLLLRLHLPLIRV